jgi:hypothetical protein
MYNGILPYGLNLRELVGLDELMYHMPDFALFATRV